MPRRFLLLLVSVFMFLSGLMVLSPALAAPVPDRPGGDGSTNDAHVTSVSTEFALTDLNLDLPRVAVQRTFTVAPASVVQLAESSVDEEVGVVGVVAPELGSVSEIHLREIVDGSAGPWRIVDFDRDAGAEGPGVPGSDAIVVAGVDAVQVAMVSAEPVTASLSVVTSAQASGDSAASDLAWRNPDIRSRRAWGADESLVRDPYRYAEVTGAMIHHTAGANSYTADQVPAILRSIQAYHVNGRGWNDIAYNLLVDKFGRTWEGRGGGVDRAVQGGHAWGVTNERVFGISMLGNYEEAKPTTAALDAIERAIAWKFSVHEVDPYGATWGSGGQDGGSIELNAISGHRDENATLCPGANIYSEFSRIRTNVARYLATIYKPVEELPVAGAFVPLEPARLLDSREGTGFRGKVPANGGTVTLQVAGRGGVPEAGAGAVVLNVTVTNATQAGFVTAYPSDAAMPNASNLNFVGGQTIPNLVIVKLGADGRMKLSNNSGMPVDLIADVAGYYAAGAPVDAGTFVGLEPARILDSRSAIGAIGPIAAGGVVDLQVTGRGGVPVSGVSAVVINVTVTNARQAGFVTAYPAGTAAPNASNLNVLAGQTIANLVTVKVGKDGRVSLKNSSGQSVDLVADVAGYYLDGVPSVEGAFVSLAPSRLLDTRTGTGARGPVRAMGIVELGTAGRGGVPASGVGAVVLNTTVTEPKQAGFVTVYPGGTQMPNASNLNFSAGQTIPNLVVVKVGPGGQIDLANNSGRDSQLIADVAGYFLTKA